MVDWRSLTSPEKLQAFNQYCEDFGSYTSHAKQLGSAGIRGATRNAIAGFIHRNRPSITIKIGDRVRRKPAPSCKKPARVKPGKKPTGAKPGKIMKAPKPEKTLPPVEEILKLPARAVCPDKALRVPFLDYTRGVHCNYPLWNNDPNIPSTEKFVCGAPPTLGSNYCRFHHDFCNPPASNQYIRSKNNQRSSR